MKYAVIYARYSSERQNDQSIEGQLRICNKYAEDNTYYSLYTIAPSSPKIFLTIIFFNEKSKLT